MTMTNLSDRDRLPAYLVGEPITKAVTDALRDMGERAAEVVLTVADQFSPATATWGLDAWERITGITAPQSTLDARRAAVLTKLAGTSTTTDETIRQLVLQMTGYDSRITEKYAEYTVEVTFLGESAGLAVIDLTLLYQAADIVLPAHLLLKVSTATWGAIESVGMTWAMIEAQNMTWDMLENACPIEPK